MRLMKEKIPKNLSTQLPKESPKYWRAMALVDSKKESLFSKRLFLPKPELASLVYHNIFDYPMTKVELKKWKFGPKTKNRIAIKARKIGQYCFLAGRDRLVAKRQHYSNASLRKIERAKAAARVLGSLPSVKMVGITGALAMMNAGADSDVDLLIVTSRGTLWTTRLLVYAKLDLLGIPRRRYGARKQKDRLCLNMWLDETDLVWSKADRNLYTAHEIAQIIPLVNKDNTYERFINKNSCIKYYLPNAVKIPKLTSAPKETISLLSPLEPFARSLQFWYMRKKITREVISPTKAIFHPR